MLAGLCSGIWGKIGKCDECGKNKNLRDVWGCQNKTRLERGYVVRELKDDTILHYVNCPVKYISDAVWNFYDMYNYYKEFPSAAMPEYSNVSPRFWQAHKLFSNKLNEFTAEMMKEKK